MNINDPDFATDVLTICKKVSDLLCKEFPGKDTENASLRSLQIFFEKRYKTINASLIYNIARTTLLSEMRKDMSTKEYEVARTEAIKADNDLREKVYAEHPIDLRLLMLQRLKRLDACCRKVISDHFFENVPIKDTFCDSDEDLTEGAKRRRFSDCKSQLGRVLMEPQRSVVFESKSFDDYLSTSCDDMSTSSAILPEPSPEKPHDP